jgi:hypothetical protein
MNCSGEIAGFAGGRNAGERFWLKARRVATKKRGNFCGDLRRRQAFL